QGVDELRDQRAVVQRIRQDFALRDFSSTWHVSVALGLTRYFFGRLAPYFERPCLRPCTPTASRVPRTTWYRTPGRSFTRPPRMSTSECSCRLWPTPGMYVVTSMPLVSRTRATLRSAED